jgi:hypothetical protein
LQTIEAISTRWSSSAASDSIQQIFEAVERGDVQRRQPGATCTLEILFGIVADVQSFCGCDADSPKRESKDSRVGLRGAGIPRKNDRIE